jgi:hypothetical protein
VFGSRADVLVLFGRTEALGPVDGRLPNVGEDNPEDIRGRVAVLPIGPLPAPWRDRGRLPVDGLTAVGVGVGDDGAEYVLTIGRSGRAVVSAGGRRVAHDDDPPGDAWYFPDRLVALGIGPLRGRLVTIAGVCGGGLVLRTVDDWSVLHLPASWPLEHVVLQSPGAGLLGPGREHGCLLLGDNSMLKLRAFGFSASGRLLVLATSGGVQLWSRPAISVGPDSVRPPE